MHTEKYNIGIVTIQYYLRPERATSTQPRAELRSNVTLGLNEI